MFTKKTIFFSFLFSCTVFVFYAQKKLTPGNLTVNLLSKTNQVYVNGYPSTTNIEEAFLLQNHFEFTEISTRKPFFGWVVPSQGQHITQTAYRILVASKKEYLQKDSADMWDSGKVSDCNSINIFYLGKDIEPNKVYFWKVNIWNQNDEESGFSPIAAFKTDNNLTNYATDRYPIQKQDEYPVTIKSIDKSHYFVDFGKASFGRIRVNLYSDNETDSVTIHLGEAVKNGSIDRSPGGSIRYSKYKIALEKGWRTYVVTIRSDKRNTGRRAVLVPDYIGEVTPFRYCEVENYKHPLQKIDLVRETAFYPFNEFESHFHSSDTVLNQIWDLSKYSIKATSFTGVYIDGDRERIPYEADALINQLSHYCVVRDYSMARFTQEYLIHNPTWPTEWIMQSVLMAWEDYLYTGNRLSLAHHYDDLKAKTLTVLSDENGFISTLTGKVTPDVLKSIHLKDNIRDIVDWPHTGILGLEKEENGETDGFVFKEINTVVNAYHYRALTLMARIAETLGKSDDMQFYNKCADKLKESFNNQLFDKKRGIYVDGVGTDHASLHANMFPLAFGLIPENRIKGVLKFISSRGMACSVYGAQFLLDGLYDANDAAYGLQLLKSTGERSWYNMIRAGSTITMEAWDKKYKPNQDWNHAWGAAPANIIPRKLMGIEPLEPGFRKIRIKPQPGSLKLAEIKHPTIRGEVKVNFTNDQGRSFRLETDIPANTTAIIYLPYYSKNQTVRMNGEVINYRREGNFSVIDNVGSGKNNFFVVQ